MELVYLPFLLPPSPTLTLSFFLFLPFFPSAGRGIVIEGAIENSINTDWEFSNSGEMSLGQTVLLSAFFLFVWAGKQILIFFFVQGFGVALAANMTNITMDHFNLTSDGGLFLYKYYIPFMIPFFFSSNQFFE